MSAFTALLPVLLGGAILEHGEVEFHLPVFDKVKLTSALSFDLGVDLVVIGLILMAFAAFGEDLPEAPAADRGDDSDAPDPVVLDTADGTEMSVLLAFAAAFLFAAGRTCCCSGACHASSSESAWSATGRTSCCSRRAGRGVAPIIGTADPADFADPLPQALALTSIVITFGVTAFLLALGYRSWRITHDDVVEDDVEDRFIARRTSRRPGGRGGETRRARAGHRRGPPMSSLVPLPVIVPLLGASLAVLRRHGAGRSA